MAEVKEHYAVPLPTTPDRMFSEIKDFIARADEGHSTAEVALARIIEHIATNNARFISEACLNAGVLVPCDCNEYYE